MALSADFNVPTRDSGEKSYPVAASTTIYKGGLICVNTSGYAVPGATTSGFRFVGVADRAVANTGAAGAKNVIVLTGKNFRLTGTGLSQASVGLPVYVSDDATVSLSPNGPFVGVITEYISSTKAWVFIPYNGVPASTDVLESRVSLTSAQVKTLEATPVTLAPAPGADLAIVPLAINLVVNYGGTNVFTESSDDLSVCYATTPASNEILEIESTGLITESVDEWRYISFAPVHLETFIPVENDAVVLTNLDDEIAGNAAGDNTLHVRFWYRIVPTDA